MGGDFFTKKEASRYGAKTKFFFPENAKQLLRQEKQRRFCQQIYDQVSSYTHRPTTVNSKQKSFDQVRS